MNADAPASRPSRSLWLLAAGAAYIILGSLLAYVVYYRTMATAPGSEGIFDLGFFFGPLVKNIAVGNGYFGDALGVRFTAHRMPLPPLLLAAVARSHNRLLTALLVKNAIFGGLLVWGVYRARPLVACLPSVVVAALALLALSMPQVLHYTFSLEMEEGYLIGPVFFLFVHFLWLVDARASKQLRPSRLAPWTVWTWLALALLDGSLFLIKSSMLPTALLFAALFWAGTRRWRVGAGFLTCCCAAVLAWGLHNAASSGRFTIGSSFDGWNGYKGNNELARTIYPARSLDVLEEHGLVGAPAGVRDEWAFDAYYRKKILTFVRQHPLEELKLFSLKAYVFFFSMRTFPLPAVTNRFQRLMYGMNTVYMVPFRSLMAAAVFYSLWRIRPSRRPERVAEPGTALAAWGFLLLIACYATPFLAGFVYQRHVIPLVLPVIMYAAWMLNALAADYKLERRLGPARE